MLNPTETAFTKTGFRDWKHAKENGKGLHRHQFSNDHLRAVDIYEEWKIEKFARPSSCGIARIT